MVDSRGDWESLIEEAAGISSVAVELSALSEAELPGLLRYLEAAPRLPFLFVSVHAPSKGRLDDDEHRVVADLCRIPSWVDAIVVHPDTMSDLAAYRPLGRRLVIENMDTRKTGGQTAQELERYFAQLPKARLCFDLAHAKDVDATLKEASETLRRFSSRLSHVHLSSLDDGKHHVALTLEDEQLFAPLLARCRDVPWILEAHPFS